MTAFPGRARFVPFIAPRWAVWGALLLQAACMPPAMAETFPSRPIRIIVSTAPGGMTDTLARAVAQAMAESVGQAVIVENRPGAGSLLGMGACAKAAPDGYTVCIADNQSLVYNPLLFKTLPYDPDHGFVPVSALAANMASVILAPVSLPMDSFKDVVAFAKQHPGKLNFATWGPGSTGGLYYSWIAHQNDIDITAIPYKGAAPTLVAVSAGQVDLAYNNLGIAEPLVKAGKVKILAVTGSTRSPDYPDIPTLGEMHSDPELENYFGIFAPAGTPKPAVAFLSKEFAKAMKTPVLQRTVEQNFLKPMGTTPDEFGRLIDAAKVRAAYVFKTAGVEQSDAPGEAPAQRSQ